LPEPLAFNQHLIETIARINQRAIIFPYSNPTSHSACPADIDVTLSFGGGSPSLGIQCSSDAPDKTCKTYYLVVPTLPA
jgi:malic enzyme